MWFTLNRSFNRLIATTMTRWFIIGLSGVTCGGKTTLAKRLHETIQNSAYINQDCYYLPSDDLRHEHNEELDHHNWDILKSLDMEQMHMDVLKLIESSEDTTDKICAKKDSETRILIIDGTLIFDYKPIADLCHLKYFFTLTKQLCWQRRQDRVYDPPDVPGYFEKIAWPEYIKYKDRIEKDNELYKTIIFIDGGSSAENVFQKILSDVTE